MGVTFNGDNTTASRPRSVKNKTGIIGLLIKTGIAKDVKQANLVMLVLIGCLCVVTFFSLASLNDGGESVEVIDPASRDQDLLP